MAERPRTRAQELGVKPAALKRKAERLLWQARGRLQQVAALYGDIDANVANAAAKALGAIELLNAAICDATQSLRQSVSEEPEA